MKFGLAASGFLSSLCPHVHHLCQSVVVQIGPVFVLIAPLIAPVFFPVSAFFGEARNAGINLQERSNKTELVDV